MTNPISALADLAVTTYRSTFGGSTPTTYETVGPYPTDPILAELSGSFRPHDDALPAFGRVTAVLGAEPDLAPLLPTDGEPDPMITYVGGGFRDNFESLIWGLLYAARRQMFILRLERNEATFARLVLENYEELKRAVRGEPVRVYGIIGYSGVLLQDSHSIATPWGVLHKAQLSDRYLFRTSHTFGRETTAVLTSPRLTKVAISRAASTDVISDSTWATQSRRARDLLPLTFALATVDAIPCAPSVTFETALPPFGSGFWYSVSLPLPSVVAPTTLTADQIADIEDWSRRVDKSHVDTLQVAASRIVSAISQRLDKADALIDAVTAWESIVGTRTETVYRVTAALAKLLEPNPEKRTAFRKELGKVYDTRSRVVHGDLVEQSDVDSAADRAVEVGLRTLKALYLRSDDWLKAKSGDRADRLILEE